MQRTIGYITALVILSSAPIAYAQSTLSIQAQIEALLQQVAQLQLLINQPTTPTYTPPVVQTPVIQTPTNVTSTFGQCPLLERTLKPGSTGGDVANLQAFLAGDSTIYPERSITAYYGARTEAAVQRFQTRFGIVTSGTPDTTGFGAVGPATRAAIRSLCTTAQPPVYVPTPTSPTPTYANCYAGTAAIASGASVPMYSISNVPYGSSCASYMQLRQCSNGTLSGNASYQYLSCTENKGASCFVNGNPMQSGETRTMYSRPSVGSNESCSSFAQTRSCVNGTLSGDSNYTYNTCSTQSYDSCVVNGTTLAHGSSRVFYSQTTATSSVSCSAYAQTRTCNDGVLSGDSKYTQTSCSAGACSVDGVTLQSGQSQTFYFAKNVPAGEVCSSYAQTRTCTNGSLSGSASYAFASCAPVSSGNCALDGVSVSNGASAAFYSMTVATAGTVCSAHRQVRTCTNGTLNGSATYNRASCSDTQSCTLDGVTLSHASSSTFYSARTVAFGSTCSSVSQTRTCTNGSLSGGSSYQYASCAVNPPTSLAPSSQLAAALSAIESILRSMLAKLTQ